MQVETLGDLMHWTRDTHQHLGQCFASCGEKQAEPKAQQLLQTLAVQEKSIVDALERIEREADEEALHTEIHDQLARSPIDADRLCAVPYDSMSYEEIADSAVDTHNQLIDLYRYVTGIAGTPEARQLSEDLLSMEEHESMLIAQQAGRS